MSFDSIQRGKDYCEKREHGMIMEAQECNSEQTMSELHEFLLGRFLWTYVKINGMLLYKAEAGVSCRQLRRGMFAIRHGFTVLHRLDKIASC